jgi:hypothetical protein
MKIKSLIALAALAPTIVLAQVIMNSNSSQAKPPMMPPAQTTSPSQMGKMGDIEQRKPITPGNASTSNPSQSTILKDEESTKAGSKKSSDPTTSVGTVSDQRLKRDINQLTTMPNGIKLYSFKYLWSDDVYIGVMAQDLLSNPQWKDAVIASNTGYYSVDYSKLGTQMMTLGQYKLQQQQSNVAVANQ